MKKMFVLALVILLASVIVASGCVQNLSGSNSNKAAANSSASAEVGSETIPAPPSDAGNDTTPTVPPF